MIRRARLGFGVVAGLAALGGHAHATETATAIGPAERTVETAPAPDRAPVPRPRTAAPPARVATDPASEERARELARDAARAYSLALGAPPDEQAAKFAEALALFDRIVTEHPESAVARDAADGAIGLIDVDALRAFAAVAAPRAEPVSTESPAADRLDDAAARAAAALCGGADAACADALAAAARPWIAAPVVLAALSAPLTPASAAERFQAFRDLLAMAEFATFEAATAQAAPLAALVALDAVGSARAPTPPAAAAWGASDDDLRRAARLWSDSAVSLALLADNLVADGAPAAEVDALALRAAALNRALFESLARGEASGALTLSEGPRRLSAAERRFLDDLFALSVDTQAALLGAAGNVTAADRASALAQWLDATALAASPWRTALTDTPEADPFDLH